jgi:hypothetical protein
MKDIVNIINESTKINEGYESFYQDLKKKGLPDNIIFAIWDNRSSDGKVGIDMLCAVLKEIYKDIKDKK